MDSKIIILLRSYLHSRRLPTLKKISTVSRFLYRTGKYIRCSLSNLPQKVLPNRMRFLPSFYFQYSVVSSMRFFFLLRSFYLFNVSLVHLYESYALHSFQLSDILLNRTSYVLQSIITDKITQFLMVG